MAEKNKKRFQELSRKIEYGDKGGALSNAKVAYQKWLNTNTGIKLLKDGKRQTVYKTGDKKGQVFDEKAGLNQFNQEYYGTTTPRKDLKFLQKEAANALKINTLRNDGVRTRLSKKDFEGKNIYQQEIDLREKKLGESLDKLRIGTSFENKPVEEEPKIEKAVVTDPAGEAFKRMEGVIEPNPNEGLYAFADELRANENRQKLNLGEMNKVNPIEETIDFPELSKAPNLNTEVSEMAFKGTDSAAFDAVRSKIAKDPSRIQEGLMKSGFTADRLAGLVIKNRKFQANKRKRK